MTIDCGALQRFIDALQIVVLVGQARRAEPACPACREMTTASDRALQAAVDLDRSIKVSDRRANDGRT